MNRLPGRLAGSGLVAVEDSPDGAASAEAAGCAALVVTVARLRRCLTATG